MILFTSGSLLTWGKSLDALPGISPRYLPAIYPQLTTSPYLLQTLHYGRVCLFPTESTLVEKRYGSPVGGYQYLPSTALVPTSLSFPGRTVLLDQARGLGEGQKLCHDITFLLVLAEEEATGARIYGLSTVWVNPSQARVPSMEEAVGKLTICTFSGPNWPYALVQLHEGIHHVPLPKEGHLGILPQRGAEVTPCRQISQLEVCQLIITGPQVVYPIGLNRCNKPIITSLPEPLASGISLTTGKLVYLEIDILQSPAEDPDQKVLPLGKVSTIVVTSPPKSTPQNWKERAA